MKKVLTVAVVLMLLATAGNALASGTTQLNVSATVLATCKFQTAGPTALNINADPSSGAAATGTTAALVFWCTNGTAFSFAQDTGLHGGTAGALGGALNLSDGVNPNIGYTLSASTAAASGSGFSSPANDKTVTFTATIPLANYQNAPASTYTDTVIVTINP